jgi:16S rRNA processing protein RimM
LQRGDYVAVARILRPQGRRGEVASEMLSDHPERYQTLRRVFLQAAGGSPYAAQVEKAWLHKGRVILKLAGVDSISQAEQLHGALVLLPWSERLPLSGNAYYVSDLAGCRVQAKHGGQWVEVGTVETVEPAAGAPLLRVISGGGEEILIPLAQEICQAIDVEAGIIRIDPPEDLLDLNTATAASAREGDRSAQAEKGAAEE